MTWQPGAHPPLCQPGPGTLAQGCNLVRAELGLETTYVPAADPALQMDIVPKATER